MLKNVIIFYRTTENFSEVPITFRKKQKSKPLSHSWSRLWPRPWIYIPSLSHMPYSSVYIPQIKLNLSPVICFSSVFPILINGNSVLPDAQDKAVESALSTFILQYSVHQQILLVLPSKYTQSLTSHYLYSYHILPYLLCRLGNSLLTIISLILCFLIVYSQHSSHGVSFKT